MPKPVDRFPGGTARPQARYRWDQLLDGQIWEVNPEEDYGIKMSSFRAAVYQAALTRYVRVVTQVHGNLVTLQAFDPSDLVNRTVKTPRVRGSWAKGDEP